jgi:carotenoid cleavage dioxygenase
MGFVIDAQRQTTDFVILDAQNFSGPPQAVVTIPHRIPAGFHGNWVPTQR